MSAAALWRWLPAHGLRQPLVWAMALFLLLLGPLGSRLAPLGSLASDPALALARHWAFPAGLLGVSLGLLALGRRAPFVELLPFRARWRGELGALLIAALGMQLPLWFGLALARGVLVPGPAALSGILLCDLHLAALAVLVARWRAAPGARAVAYVVLVGALPGLLSGTDLTRKLSALFDPARHVSLVDRFELIPALSALAAIAALLCASHRLTLRSSPGTASLR